MRDLLVLSKNDLLEISMMHECRYLSLDETIESARRFHAAVPDRRKKLIIDYLGKIGIETEEFEKLFRSINPGDLILDPIVKGGKISLCDWPPPGPRLGRLKGWLHRRQVEEASRTEEDVLFLSEIDWGVIRLSKNGSSLVGPNPGKLI